MAGRTENKQEAMLIKYSPFVRKLGGLDPRGRVLELEAPNRRRKRNENSKEGTEKIFKSSFDDSRFPGLKPNHASRIFWVKLAARTLGEIHDFCPNSEKLYFTAEEIIEGIHPL